MQKCVRRTSHIYRQPHRRRPHKTITAWKRRLTVLHVMERRRLMNTLLQQNTAAELLKCTNNHCARDCFLQSYCKYWKNRGEEVNIWCATQVKARVIEACLPDCLTNCVRVCVCERVSIYSVLQFSLAPATSLQKSAATIHRISVWNLGQTAWTHPVQRTVAAALLSLVTRC